MMTHVFISYSKKNRAYARQLADHLIQLGFDVWIDDQIDYGNDWWRTIVQAIRTAKAFVVVMTDESDHSEWVQREVTLADKYRIPPFPLWLSGDFNNSDNWAIYVRTQYRDVRDGGLPPDDFFERIATVAPRHQRPGANVTHNPPPVIEAHAADLAEDFANPPAPETGTLPAWSALFRKERLSSRAGLIVIGIAILAVVAFAALNQFGQLQATVTPTATSDKQQALVPTSTSQPPASVNPTRAVTETTQPLVTSQPTPATTFTLTLSPVVLPSPATALTPIKACPSTYSSVSLNTYLSTSSPVNDASQIIYSSFLDGNWQISMINADGSNLVRLTNDEADDKVPAWSPDGRQIAFTSNRDEGFNEINIMNADGTNLHQITCKSNDTLPAWSPDGSQIIFISARDGNDEIYTVNIDTGNLFRLTNNSGVDWKPSWSPDGKRIVFSSDRDGNTEIYTMYTDGSNLRRLTNNDADDTRAAWSPDGKRIVFSSNRDGNYEIYIMAADGSNPQRITNNLVSDSDPSWSPHGTQIAFTSNRDGNSKIYLMNTDGSNQHRLATTTSYGPQWRPLSSN